VTGQLADWPWWDRRDPSALLGYVQGDGAAVLLPGLTPRSAASRGDVRAQTGRLYDLFAAAGIRLTDEPLADDRSEQAVRTPDEVLAAPRHGNCLDLSVTFAGACLEAGLHPLIIVLDRTDDGPAHAVVVVWLGGHWPGPGAHLDYEGPDDQAQALTGMPRWPGGGLCAAADEPGAFLPIDTSLAASCGGDPAATFAEAVRSAAAMLAPGQATWRWSFGLDVGLRYTRAGSRPVPGRPLVAPLTAPYLDPGSRADRPLGLIQARNGAVPFLHRDELTVLLDWCRRPDADSRRAEPDRTGIPDRPPVRIGVLEGIGGAGKTRLAAELAHRLAAEHWHTGFLTDEPDATALDWLSRVVAPLLVVVDYGEAMPVESLRTVIRSLSVRRARTVVLFTARSRGDWWPELDRRLTRDGVLRGYLDPMVVAARHPDPARLYRRAYRRFAARIADPAGVADVPDPPNPSDSSAWSTLETVTLAWLAAHGTRDLPTTRASLYDDIVERELDHWASALVVATASAPRMPQPQLRSVAACVSLLSPTADQLQDVLAASGLGVTDNAGPLAEMLSGLLAGADGTLRLLPDPVAEHLLVTMFPGDEQLYAACLDTLFGRDRSIGPARSRAERLADNLTRAGQGAAGESEAAAVRDMAATALRRHEPMWPAALEIALHRGGPFVAGLEELARREDSPLPLERIATTVAPEHSELWALALTAAQRLQLSPRQSDLLIRQYNRAAGLIILAVRQQSAGLVDQALATARQSVEVARDMGRADHELHLPVLALALNNRGAILSGADRHAPALTPLTEALGIYRQLSGRQAHAHRADLANTLINLGQCHATLGNPGEGVRRLAEAVEILRSLVADSPQAHYPALALALSNLALALADLDRLQEAFEVSTEAVAVCRDLAASRPAAHLPALGRALSNHASRCTDQGRQQDAFHAIDEAVRILRRMAEHNPAVHRPQLAVALGKLAEVLLHSGQARASLDPVNEALAILRALAEPPHRQLAAVLRGAANVWQRLHRPDEAVRAAREEVDLRRALAASNPPEQAELAAGLTTLAAVLADAGEPAAAAERAAEAAELSRRLADGEPVHRPLLARILQVSAELTADAETARRLCEESVALYRALAAQSPARHVTGLSLALASLGYMHTRTGHHDLALRAYEEALDLLRGQAGSRPDELANALINVAVSLEGLGRVAEAAAATGQAEAVYRQLAADDPEAYLPDHALALQNLGAMLAANDQAEPAMTATEESVAAYRLLAAANPDYRRDLAGALNNLAIRLGNTDRADRAEQAVAAATEAVGIYREPADGPAHDDHSTLLATALAVQANTFASVGDLVRAVGVAQQALALRRTLAATGEPAHVARLATSAEELGELLSAAGQAAQAAATTTEAVRLNRDLATANPGAHLPDLAASLHLLSGQLAAAGDPAQAHPAADEAVKITQRLVAHDPRRYMNTLAEALDGLGDRLHALDRDTEALNAFEAAWTHLDGGDRATLKLARAGWRAGHGDSLGPVLDVADAARDADEDRDPQRAAPARRSIRLFVHQFGLTDATHVPLPAWATTPLPDEFLDALGDLVAAESLDERIALLDGRHGTVLFAPDGDAARATVAALFGDDTTMGELLELLELGAGHSVEQVVEMMREVRRHQADVLAWINTPSWAESLRYAVDRPELLADPRTEQGLEIAADNPVARQHLAIVRLARTMALEAVYDAVTDLDDAAEAALAAFDTGDGGTLAELLCAAPGLAQAPFVGGVLAAVVAVYDGDHARARAMLVAALPRGGGASRRFWSHRMAALAARWPAHAPILRELADTLSG
jgi:tetratricopeptide (TPR) repeat protein